MSEESQILVASGSGIQTVPQLAAPQLVYLDFEGKLLTIGIGTILQAYVMSSRQVLSLG